MTWNVLTSYAEKPFPTPKQCLSTESLPRQPKTTQVGCINADIEKQWAVKSMHHAETYFKLLTAIPGSKLKMTAIDGEIYADFRSEFPDLDIVNIREMEDFKNEASKAKWRDFINKYALLI